MSIIIGFIIGSVLGLTGAGGSIFAVPLLILLLNLAPSEAMGIGLGAVMASAMLGTIGQRQQVLWIPALLLALGGALFAPLGKYVSTLLNDTTLLVSFSVLAVVIALRMFQQAIQHPSLTAFTRATSLKAADSASLACRLSQTGQFSLHARCISGLVLGGALVGFASGLFGVGGGFLIVPLILFLSSVPMSQAIATSLAVITVISASGFATHLAFTGFPNYAVITQVLVGAVFGMFISQRFSNRLAGQSLQIIFSTLLILVVLTLMVTHFV